ncbi:MAG TPA: glycosyltransferase [Streptosporangiaceae bacterium]
MPSSRAPEVAIIIPARDRAASLRLTLTCLAGQPGIETAQVILVNDGGDEQIASAAARASTQLNLTIAAGPRRGRAAARNTGAALATAPQLIFLDSDILVSSRFVAAHLAAASDRSFGHGQLRELPTARRLLAELADTSFDAIGLTRNRLHAGQAGRHYRLTANALERAIEAIDDGSIADVAPWLGCVGANVCVPRREFERVGGFDEDFGVTWGCEDLELGFRLHAHGLRRRLVRPAAGIHLSHARPGRWAEHASNLDLFIAKHPVPSVRALTELLSAGGNPRLYAEAVATAGRAELLVPN